MSNIKKIAKKTVKFPKINTYYLDKDDDNFIIRDTIGNEIFYFDIDELPYCCGVLEIGNVGTSMPKAIGDEQFRNIIDNSLGNFVANETHGKKCHTMIANLNGSVACNILKEAFIRTGLFEPVKTFNNSTGSVITIWMSNN